MRLRRRSDPLIGTVEVPGDKSITHRAAIVAALASERSMIANANVGADVRATVAALRALGAAVDLDADNRRLVIEGSESGALGEPDGVIDAGNSGTTARLMLGVCAAVDGLSVVTGDDSLRGRPMLRVAAPLRQMGATIDGRRHADRLPLAVRGGSLSGIEVVTPVASAQLKTSILLAGMGAAGTTAVVEPAPSRDHTERMLPAVGVPLRRDGLRVAIDGGARPRGFDMRAPGDLSAALFLVGGATIVPGSRLTVEEVGLNPTRAAALDVLRAMGARLEWAETHLEIGEPVGTVRAEASELRGVAIDPGLVPALIDEVPILAVVATQAQGETTIGGAAELRVKESDRIAALCDGLRALGADVEARPDGLAVRGPTPLSGGEVSSHGDHRVAMAFAIAGLVANDNVRVEGWSCVETSFPDFLDVLGRAQGSA